MEDASLDSNEHRLALVTGAGGFIGSHLVDELLARGWRVRAVDRRSPSGDSLAARNLAHAIGSPRFAFEHVDVAGPHLGELLAEVDAVFHLAAATGVRGSWGKNFASYVQDNITATHQLIEQCERAGVPRLVVASSSSVYGGAAGGASSESGAVRPLSPYGVSKLAAEQLALAYAARRDAATQVVALRFFTVYGPRQREDMAIARMLNAVRTGRAMRLYGDGSQRRNFTYVSDVVAALVRAEHTALTGRAVNVAGPATLSVRELLELVAEVTGRSVPFVEVAARSGDPEATEADFELSRTVLAYRPQVWPREGIAAQWEWMHHNGTRGHA
ncbi:hypothetical protein DN069_07705 [Streptacidiphilus pinicola]|uniref:NAD-dependent epimerase/dehydratase domain-containing protein n=1 Tax=Streptacidiphilus pinicola TaxID=2219663 RepID=A0A2X0IM70_9ACTN|nr:NAD-dependent epimerase/dehydratase family protein [Streptacidiphilus pinicola]RAG86232.1 hypothetical protein DN069_07705 [Streptacidiphilus pinicola]